MADQWPVAPPVVAAELTDLAAHVAVFPCRSVACLLKVTLALTERAPTRIMIAKNATSYAMIFVL